MKKLLFILGLTVLIFANATADGTFNPLNGTLRRLALDFDHDGNADRFANSADGFEMHIFYGPANSESANLIQFPQFYVIGAVDGIFVTPGVLSIPGTESQDIISLQMRFNNPLGWQAETKVIQVVLGPDQGPGAVVWGSREDQFNTANTFTLSGSGVSFIRPVPEPSTLALGALGGFMLLFRLRRQRQ